MHRKVVESFQFPNEEALSERENEVLKLLAKGKSYGAIAQELFLSVEYNKDTYKKDLRKITCKQHKKKLFKSMVECK